MKDRKLIGKLGEDLAASMLYGDGYQILTRNFRSHYGEVDIVCEKEGTIYFVEVKTRTCSVFGEPGESVNEVKQYRMKKTAEYYLMTRKREIETLMRNKYDSAPGSESYTPCVMFKVIEIMVRETEDALWNY